MPCGFDRAGLPIGLCIVAPRFGEARMLALARAYEAATDWRERHPTLDRNTPLPPLPRSVTS